MTMNRCTFCGREAEEFDRQVNGYYILTCCGNCEDEIIGEEEESDAEE